MKTVDLLETAVIFLNGSGNGTARVGPLSAREVWHPSNVSISANANAVKESQCSVYVGNAVAQSNFRDGCVNGSAGDSTDKVNADTIKMGKFVWAVWTGGDAGVQAVLTVTGTKDV